MAAFWSTLTRGSIAAGFFVSMKERKHQWLLTISCVQFGSTLGSPNGHLCLMDDSWIERNRMFFPASHLFKAILGTKVDTNQTSTILSSSCGWWWMNHNQTWELRIPESYIPGGSTSIIFLRQSVVYTRTSFKHVHPIWHRHLGVHWWLNESSLLLDISSIKSNIIKPKLDAKWLMVDMGPGSISAIRSLYGM